MIYLGHSQISSLYLSRNIDLSAPNVTFAPQIRRNALTSSMFSAKRDETQIFLHKIPSKYSGKEQEIICYTLGQLQLRSVGPQMTYIDALILSG